jgi:hypothetical protein
MRVWFLLRWTKNEGKTYAWFSIKKSCASDESLLIELNVWKVKNWSSKLC